jgi:hypothetical protein
MYKWSWAFAAETSYGVRSTNPYTAMRATPPEFTMGDDAEELNLAVGSKFTTTPKQVGSTHGGTFTFQVPIRSQVPGYTVAGPLVLNPEWQLVQDHMGALHTGVNAAADVAAGSTAVLVNLTATDVDEGAAVYFADGANVVAAGWAQDSSGAGPYALTMFENMRAAPAENNNLHGMLTAYPADVQPPPRSYYLQGPLSDHGLYLLGAVVTGMTKVVANGKVPLLTVECTFDGWEYSTTGAILTPDAYTELPAEMGVRGGRLRINGDQTGDADPTGTCGLGELTIELPTDVYNDPCHGAPQGYAGIETAASPCRVSFQYPWTSDFVDPDGRSFWDRSYEDGDTFSLTTMVGDKAGATMQARFPQLVVKERAQLSIEGKTWVWAVTAEPPDTYGDDTGTTGPANAKLSFAIG